jgi:hypothetical protein
MSVTIAPETTAATPSPAGPLAADAPDLPLAPMLPLSRARQTLRFGVRQIEFVFRARRELGDVFGFDAPVPYDVTFTCHPDHVKALMTAKPDEAVSATGDSPLRPIVGGDSVLTAIGARHLRQRKLLLPPFHGEAVARYAQMIADVADREIDRWPIGKPFALAPRMQEVTLEVIMGGIFGIHGTPPPGSPEAGLMRTVRMLADASTHPLFQLVELMQVRHTAAKGVLKAAMSLIDRHLYAVIANGRSAADLEERTDILALLLRTTTEDGEPLSDGELRNELLTLNAHRARRARRPEHVLRRLPKRTVSGPPNGWRSSTSRRRRARCRARRGSAASPGRSPRPARSARAPGSSASASGCVVALVDLELGVGDRVAVRVVRRVAELGGDARLEVLGDHVLERLGLVVHAVPRHAEVLGEVELEQAVVAQHLERDALALVGQLHARGRARARRGRSRRALQHRRRRRRRDAEPLGERVRPDGLAVRAALERVDRLRVVLDASPWLAARRHQTLTSRPVANISARPASSPPTATGCSGGPRRRAASARAGRSPARSRRRRRRTGTRRGSG